MAGALVLAETHRLEILSKIRKCVTQALGAGSHRNGNARRRVMQKHLGTSIYTDKPYTAASAPSAVDARAPSDGYTIGNPELTIFSPSNSEHGPRLVGDFEDHRHGDRTCQRPLWCSCG